MFNSLIKKLKEKSKNKVNYAEVHMPYYNVFFNSNTGELYMKHSLEKDSSGNEILVRGSESYCRNYILNNKDKIVYNSLGQYWIKEY